MVVVNFHSSMCVSNKVGGVGEDDDGQEERGGPPSLSFSSGNEER